MSKRGTGEGVPPLIPIGLGLLTAFLMVSSFLTSTRIVLAGQDADGRIVELMSKRRITWVKVEYQLLDGRVIRSSRGSFNGEELVALAQRVGRYDGLGAFDGQAMIGATVPIRYARGRPELAHIRDWVPLYRELVTSHAAWLVCAFLAVLTYRHRRQSSR